MSRPRFAGRAWPRVAAAIAIALALAGCGGDDDGGSGDPDAAACELPAEGRCAGNVVERCQDGVLVTEDCTTTQATCTATPGAGTFVCLDACAAAGVTEAGTCAGDSVRRCEVVGGVRTVVTQACAPGQVCEQPDGQPATCAADAWARRSFPASSDRGR